VTLARFGLHALRPAETLASRRFATAEARALFAGVAAHAYVPLDRAATSAIGLVLWLAAHVAGWPVARGGSGAIAAALLRHLRDLGGELVTGWRVRSIDELPRHDAVLLDVAPRALAAIAGERLPASYRRRLERFRRGPAAFKVDWALDGPVPWTADACRRAGTVHVGGTIEEVAEAEEAVWNGREHPRPFVLLAQQSLCDPTRAPAGHHVLWGYAHVPHGSRADATDAIESQVERFAPGFRERIVARHVHFPADLERANANLVGGDVAGGANDLWQLFARPVARLAPWVTPDRSIYLCSASTPPGGGVHGMCGWLAARAALRRTFRHRPRSSG
jgi:phytoene dehydrogenase-like protein